MRRRGRSIVAYDHNVCGCIVDSTITALESEARVSEHLAYQEMIEKVRHRMELSDEIYQVPRQLKPIAPSLASMSQSDEASLASLEFPSTHSILESSDADDSTVFTESSIERTLIPSRETKRVCAHALLCRSSLRDCWNY